MHQSVTAHSMNPSSADPFELPASAVETLGDPGIKLQLHGISFSHYVERARWTLRLLGLPFDQVGAGTSQAEALRPSSPKGSAQDERLWPTRVTSHSLTHTHTHTHLSLLHCTQVNYLPLLHMPSILALQRRFRQGPGSPTASSKSPAATPCLAIYSATGQPLW